MSARQGGRSDAPGSPRLARVRAVFDDWAARGRAEGMERDHAPFARRVFQRLPLERDAWYLDVGCGNGYTVGWAARAAPAGRAVGLDLSPDMIAVARRRSSGLPNVAFHEAAFPEHPLPRSRFDAVFSMEVFYYLPDLGAALAEVRRLLTTGGRFACAVNYYAENPASHTWPDEVGVPMTLLDRAGWRRALEAAGLRVTDQFQITLPPEEARDPWQATAGSLVTLGSPRGPGPEGVP